MAAPWEAYQTQTTAKKPWEAYGGDATPAPKPTPTLQEQETPETYGEYARGLSRAAGRGVTWGMAELIEAGLKAPIYAARTGETLGESYSRARGMGKSKAKEFKEKHPYIAGGAEIGGALTSGIGAAKLAKTAFPKATGALQAYGKTKPLRTTAGVSALSGGAYATGTGEGSLGKRLYEAAPTSAASALLGTGGVLVARGVGKVASGALSKRARSIDERLAKESGREFKPAGKEITKVVNKLRKDFPDDVDFKKALEEYSQESGVSLAEMGGKNLESLAKGVAQYPTGGAKAEEFAKARLEGVTGRLKESISKYVHSSKSALDDIDTIVGEGRKKASPLYKKAFAANKEGIVSKEIDRILETPAGRKALKKTVEVMQNDRKLMGLPDKELKALQRDMSAIGKMDEVSGAIAKGLNLRTLDQVKKVLDNEVRKAGNKMGKNYDPLVESTLTDLTKSLRNALDDADPSGLYKAARQEAGDYLSTKSAIISGRDFMKSSAEEIKRQMKGMSPSELDAFKIGASQRMRDGRINELVSVSDFKVSGRLDEGHEMLGKLKTILSPDEFTAFNKSMKKEEKLIKFVNKTLGGSPTASKQHAAQEFAENLGMDTVETITTGGIQSVPRRAIQSALRTVNVNMTDKSASKVADILYETDPQKKLEIMQQLTKTTEGQLIVNAAVESMESIRLLSLGRQAIEEIKPSTVGIATGVTLGRQDND